MRIIAGEYGSRRIIAPKGMETRPTLDKVREAVFSTLGGFFDGESFLDLYAGSGANGLEALSRGCGMAVFVDMSRNAIAAINENITALGCADRSRVLKMKDLKALSLLREEGKRFSLIYMDPPYAKQKNMEILGLLQEYGLLADGARVVIESKAEDSFTQDIEDLRFIKSAQYGISRVTYYKKG